MGTRIYVPVFSPVTPEEVQGVLSGHIPWPAFNTDTGTSHLDPVVTLPFKISVLLGEGQEWVSLWERGLPAGRRGFQLRKSVFAFGNAYRIELFSPGSFQGIHSHALSLLLAILGFLLTAGISVLMLRQQRSTQRLRELLNKKTRDIRHSFAPYRTASDSLAVGVALIDNRGKLHYANPRMKEWFPDLAGGTTEAFLALGGKPARGGVNAGPGTRLPDSIFQEVETSSGILTLRLSCSPAPGTRPDPLLLHMAEDVTESRIFEKRSARHQAFLQLMAEVSALLAQATDESWDDALQRTLRMLGEFFHADRCCLLRMYENQTLISNTHEWCAPGVSSQIAALQDVPESMLPWWFEQMRKHNILRFASPDDLPPEASRERDEFIREQITSMLYLNMVDERKQPIGCLGFDSTRKDMLWSDEDVSMLRLLTDTITGLLLRLEARRELRSREEQYRLLVDNSTEGVVTLELLCSKDGNVEDLVLRSLNPAFRSMFSARLSDPSARKASSVLPELLEETCLKKISEVVLLGAPASLEVEFALERPGFFSITAYSLSGLRLAAVFKDVTRQKLADTENEQLLRQLQQSQKLESIGRLAGGVAHDFNNTLQIILGNADIALKFHNPPPDVGKALEEIRQAARSSSGLTHQLLAFARQQKNTPQTLDLNQMVTNSLNMLRRLLGENIVLEWSPEPGLAPILIDPVQMDQILVNLCVNARDAMSSSGRIVLQTRHVEISAEAARKHPGARPGRYARLSVSDNGHGMSPEIQASVFDPFFTTKAPGKGTGLGLSTVLGIVLQHHGFVSLQSQEGKGTRFHLHFPYASRDTVAEAAIKPTPPAPPPTAKAEGTILIVEDEEMILKMTALLVQRLGYKAISCLSANEALERIQKAEISPDLLLTDVVMPDMSGPKLVQELKTILPDLKVLFMSGYTEDVLTPQGVFESGLDFIQKPFKLDQLDETLQRVFTRQ